MHYKLLDAVQTICPSPKLTFCHINKFASLNTMQHLTKTLPILYGYVSKASTACYKTLKTTNSNTVILSNTSESNPKH